MSNTHSATINIDGTTIHIDGIPDKCQHQWNGASYFVTSSGKLITYKTHLKWASYTDEYRSKLIIDHYRGLDDGIVGGGVTCSKCNKPFEPDFR